MPKGKAVVKQERNLFSVAILRRTRTIDLSPVFTVLTRVSGLVIFIYKGQKQSPEVCTALGLVKAWSG
jgi:hypothetical protein